MSNSETTSHQPRLLDRETETFDNHMVRVGEFFVGLYDEDGEVVRTADVSQHGSLEAIRIDAETEAGGSFTVVIEDDCARMEDSE